MMGHQHIPHDAWSRKQSASLYGWLMAVVLTCCAFVAVSVLLSGKIYGVAVLAGIVAGSVLRVIYVLRRSRGQREQALELQQELNALDEEKFALRLEAARLNGDLDRWTKEK